MLPSATAPHVKSMHMMKRYSRPRCRGSELLRCHDFRQNTKSLFFLFFAAMAFTYSPAMENEEDVDSLYRNHVDERYVSPPRKRDSHGANDHEESRSIVVSGKKPVRNSTCRIKLISFLCMCSMARRLHSRFILSRRRTAMKAPAMMITH